MEDKVITIELKASQWNAVLSALGNGPYVQVAEIIAAIKSQGEAALTTAAPSPSEE
jgi:hypothetical protein